MQQFNCSQLCFVGACIVAEVCFTLMFTNGMLLQQWQPWQPITVHFRVRHPVTQLVVGVRQDTTVQDSTAVQLMSR